MSGKSPKAFLRSQRANEAAFPPATAKDFIACYDPIYGLVKAKKLNFAELAESLNLPERRLKDVLMKRLGSGEVHRLHDQQAGWCYLCLSRVEVDREPICFACVRRICRAALKESDFEAPTRFGFEQTR
jgi:hypothetical protein